MLMHMEYQVRLPDHDWVVADKHKLIPSVYAGIVIREQSMGQTDAVSYSGPTYIAIRSGKHSSASATAHAIDFQTLIKLDAFWNLIAVDERSDAENNDGKILIFYFYFNKINKLCIYFPSFRNP